MSAETSTTPGGLRLSSDRLRVDLALPGQVYHGARFDWTGFVTQVTLDGAHTFCVPESLQPGQGSGGIGLCNEFGIDQPVGYADAAAGELFPKLGVGLLRKPVEPDYSFGNAYDIVQPFPTRVENGPQWARITVEPLDCRGYAARLVKTISVQGSQLVIAYELENTGSQVLQTHEYIHNFIGLDRQPVGPDYRLRFPYPVIGQLKVSVGTGQLMLAKNEVGFTAGLSEGLYIRSTKYTLTSQPQWELQLRSSGVGLQECDDFLPMRVAVWGTLHVISPEIFVGINLAPGARQTWTRRFEFFCR